MNCLTIPNNHKIYCYFISLIVNNLKKSYISNFSLSASCMIIYITHNYYPYMLLDFAFTQEQKLNSTSLVQQ